MLDYGTLSADRKKLKRVCLGLRVYDAVSGLYAFHNDVNCSYKDEAPFHRDAITSQKENQVA